MPGTRRIAFMRSVPDVGVARDHAPSFMLMALVHNEWKRKPGRKVGTGPTGLPSCRRVPAGVGLQGRGATYEAND
jgi:hypothetical protein